MKTETHRAASWRRKFSERHKLFVLNSKFTLSLQANQISFFPKKRILSPFVFRALPCVFQKGSLTVEAAMILPIFLLAMLAVFGYIPAYARQVDMTQKLLETAEKSAVYRAVGQTDEGSGNDGTCRKSYRDAPMVNFPGAGGLWLTAEVRVRPWTGYDGDLGLEGESPDCRIVYISDNREVYHTSPECSYLDIHLTSMSKAQVKGGRNRDGQRYTACDRCCRGYAGSVVYVSENGSHYHSSTACGGLARSPEAVLMSAIKDLSLCSRCAKGTHK